MNGRPFMRVSDDGLFLIVSRCDFLYRHGARNAGDYAAMNNNDGTIFIELDPERYVENRDLKYMLDRTAGK